MGEKGKVFFKKISISKMPFSPPQRWFWWACPLHQMVWMARCAWGCAGTHPNSASFQAEFPFTNVTQEIVFPWALLPISRGRPVVCFFRGEACNWKRLWKSLQGWKTERRRENTPPSKHIRPGCPARQVMILYELHKFLFIVLQTADE